MCGEGVIFKSSEVSNFHNWVVITDGRVFRSRQEPPHTAEMYICNLFVAYFVFSPVYANKAIFNPPPFVVLGTNTLDSDVHIYGFRLNIVGLQGLPEVLMCKKTAKTEV